MRPMLAYIIFVEESGGAPSHPIAPGGPPPIASTGPGFPTNPIYLPGGPPPVAGWGPGFPTNPIYIPITPPPESGLAPTHPIYIPVYPDQSLPGHQPHPDQGLPGNQPYPDQGLPGGSNQAAKAAFLKKAKAVADFWTGNLPPAASHPTPTPNKP